MYLGLASLIECLSSLSFVLKFYHFVRQWTIILFRYCTDLKDLVHNELYPGEQLISRTVKTITLWLSHHDRRRRVTSSTSMYEC